jgi:hypothetical protein
MHGACLLLDLQAREYLALDQSVFQMSWAPVARPFPD